MRIKLIGKGIRAVIGFKKGGGSAIQSFLFPKDRYTLSQAKTWIKSHDYSVSESWLVNDILVGPDYIEFQETLITSEMDDMLSKEIDIQEKTVKKDPWSWMFDDQ
jgi:hypothetical protein